VYENALALELSHRKIPFTRQYVVPVVYRDVVVGEHRLDLVVEPLIIELKAIKDLAPVHFAIVKSYLRALDWHHGLS
jgi:GxxExxY protein